MRSYNVETESEFLLTLPILIAMRAIDGWLGYEEGDLLIAATSRVLMRRSDSEAVVEVGSYCGRSTVVLGSVIRVVRPTVRVYAIDPHQGEISATKPIPTPYQSTYEAFLHNIQEAGLADFVIPIRKMSFQVEWSTPIALLYIDGFHDYLNVSRDFVHFDRWVVSGGYVAFHDYADYYPDVKKFVDEVVDSGRYRATRCVESLMILEKL